MRQSTQNTVSHLIFSIQNIINTLLQMLNKSVAQLTYLWRRFH